MSDLILKVLSGPNEGARARLHPNEEIAIGRDLACDVILSDQALAQTHVRLSSDGQTVHLSPIEGSVVYVAGELREASPEGGAVNCALFSPIKIGATILIVAHGEEANWPLIDLDIFSAPKREPVADVVPDEASDGEAAAPSPDEEVVVSAEGTAQTTEPQEISEEENAPMPARTGRKMVLWFIPVAVLGVLVIAFFLATQDRTPEVVLSPDEKVAGLLQQAGLSQTVTFEFDQNGGLILNGFVETSAEMVDLRYLFSDEGYAPRMKVDVLNRQVSSVKTLLDRMDVNWQVQANGESGEIELLGYVPNEFLQNQIVGVLQRDLPQLRPLDLQLITANSVKSDLDAEIAALKLSQPLKTVLQDENNVPRRMVVSGEIEPAEKARLSDTMQAFKQNLYGSTPFGGAIERLLDIQSQVTDKIVKAASPPPLVVVEKKVKPVVAKTVPSPRRFAFSGIIYGDVALAIGTNGKTYGVGDQLPNGYVISLISDKGVETSKGSRNKFYQIGKE